MDNMCAEGEVRWVGRLKLILTYKGAEFIFKWKHPDLYLATDADGEVWAYNYEPVVEEDLGSWEVRAARQGRVQFPLQEGDPCPEWRKSLMEFKV